MSTKSKTKAKSTKKAAHSRSARAKSVHLNGKAAKAESRKAAKPAPKAETRRSESGAKMDSRRTSVAGGTSSGSTPAEKTRSKHFVSAVQTYESAIKLMHAEEFEKAIKAFESLLTDHPEEPEIQERAKVLLHACEKKIQEKGKTVLRSADDHYNVGIADLNRRELDSAIQHLQQALKLTPKADHVLYALAAANALQGSRDQALQHLKQAIHFRPENRFLATRDSDFESLQEDQEFKQLVAPPEK